MKNNSTDPYNKFIDHIMNGGRVLRIDSMNNEYEILDQSKLENIENYGYDDLIILKDDTLSSIDILELIFKQQRSIIEFKLTDIVQAINYKYKKVIRPIRVPKKLISEKIRINNNIYKSKVIITGYDNKEYPLDIQIFTNSKKSFIINIYPKVHLIEPYINDAIYEKINELIIEEISFNGLLCFDIDVQDINNAIKHKE